MDPELRRTLEKNAMYLALYGNPNPIGSSPFTQRHYIIRDLSRTRRPYYVGTEMVNGKWKHKWTRSPLSAEKFASSDDVHAVIQVRFDQASANSLIYHWAPL